MKPNEKLPCVGGPLDGDEASAVFMASETASRYGMRYQLAMDDTGERYWRFAGVMARAA